MKSGEMMDVLSYKGFAKCTNGTFKGLHATKNERGHVILVEQDVAYDFWDNRFADCIWEITA